MPQANLSSGRKTARGIIIHDGHVLLVERWRAKSAQGPAAHYFAIPGGEIDPGETLEVAVVRECFEEATVVVRPNRLVARQKLPSGGESSYYLCDYLSGELKLHPESEEASSAHAPGNRYFPQWVSLDRLKDLPLHKGYEPLRAFLADALKGKLPKKVAVIKSASIKI